MSDALQLHRSLEKSEALKLHRSLEEELVYIRWLSRGLESEAEDPILDDMEEVWYELSEEEQDELNSEGTKSLIRGNDAKSSVRDWTDENTWQSSCNKIKVVA